MFNDIPLDRWDDMREPRSVAEVMFEIYTLCPDGKAHASVKDRLERLLRERRRAQGWAEAVGVFVTKDREHPFR